MKKMLMVLASAMIVGSMALAADAENNEAAKTNEHTNPITGTKTSKKTYKHKANEGDNKASVEVTETTKTKKDGTVKKSTEAKSETTDTAHTEKH